MARPPSPKSKRVYGFVLPQDLHLRIRAYALARETSLSKAAQELFAIAFHALRERYDLDINEAIEVMLSEEKAHEARSNKAVRRHPDELPRGIAGRWATRNRS